MKTAEEMFEKFIFKNQKAGLQKASIIEMMKEHGRQCCVEQKSIIENGFFPIDENEFTFISYLGMVQNSPTPELL